MLTHYHRTRGLLLVATALSAVVFWYASRQFGIPLDPGFDGSLLQHPSKLSALLIPAVVLMVCVIVSSFIAGSVRFDAGLFCALGGMAVLSLRSGTVGSVLRENAGSGSPSIFLSFAMELTVLYAMVGLAWSALWLLHRQDYLKQDRYRDSIEDTDEPTTFKAMALAMQVGVMAVAMLLLCQSDTKMQALASVAVAAYLGTISAYALYPVAPSAWFWAGPLFVGLAGYIIAYLRSSAGEWELLTGALHDSQGGFSFSALARALPLDYAIAGPIGAIYGYWNSRRWQRQKIIDTQSEAQAA